MAAWRCARCGTPLRKLVYVVVDMPAGCHRVTKQRLLDDDMDIKGADFDREYRFCPNDACGWHSSRVEPRASSPPPIEEDDE